MSAVHTAILPVHEAIYSLLAADTTLTDMLAEKVQTGGPAVLNDVGEGQEYPYVLVHGVNEKSDHTFGGTSSGLGWNLAVTIYSMSRKATDYEALTIHGRVVALLNFAALTVSGFTHATCQYAPGGDITGRTIVRDVDKLKTHQAVAEFEVWVS
jgi:hypothetical protein